MAEQDQSPGIIPGSVAVSLLMLPTPAELTKLAREGWFKAVGPDRWRLVDVVQGAIRQLRAARDEVASEELARLLDLTPARLAILANEGKLPKNRHGRYPLTASIQAYVRYLRERAGDGGDRSLSKQRARLTKSKADIAEMERGRLSGELLPKNEIMAMCTTVATTIRTRMLAVSSKYAPRLVMIRNANEVEAILRPGIEEGLEELARLEVTLAFVHSSVGGRRRRRDAEDSEAAGEADSLSVG
jgi:phage terminase Nu1 subunit (DNA packaging protein)